MKARYTTANGRIMFDIDAQGAKAIFEAIAALQELFEEPDCGCCKSKRIVCNVRDSGEYRYYTLRCVDCSAQLDFGQKRDGGSLFIKRSDKDRNPMPNRGWYIYKRDNSNAPASSGHGDADERF